MNKSTKFFPRFARMARMVQGRRGDYLSLWTAAGSIAPKISRVPATLLGWV